MCNNVNRQGENNETGKGDTMFFDRIKYFVADLFVLLTTKRKGRKMARTPLKRRGPRYYRNNRTRQESLPNSWDFI